MFFLRREFGFKSRLLIGALVVGAMFCVGGCVPKEEWVFKCGDVKISSGEYVSLMIENFMEAKKHLGGDRNPNFQFGKDLLDKMIGGQVAADWIEDKTKRHAKEWLLLSREFYKKNYSKKKGFKKYEIKSLDKDFDLEFADGKHRLAAHKIGLDKQAFIDKARNDAKCYSVLINEFGKGKPRYISEEKQREFTDQNFLKFKMLQLPKSVENRIYCETNDSNPGSKLEKKCGVKTPKELADKYIKQMADGGSIDDVIKSHNEFLGLKEAKPEFNVVYKAEDENFHEKVPIEIRNMVSELAVDSGPALKEDEKFYFILQRFKLDEEDIKKTQSKSRMILFNKESDKFVDELDAQEEIEVNEKALKKYSAKNQAKLMDKSIPKRASAKESPFGF